MARSDNVIPFSLAPHYSQSAKDPAVTLYNNLCFLMLIHSSVGRKMILSLPSFYQFTDEDDSLFGHINKKKNND